MSPRPPAGSRSGGSATSAMRFDSVAARKMFRQRDSPTDSNAILTANGIWLASSFVALKRAKLIPTGFFPKVFTTRLLGLLPWGKATALIAASERLAGRILIDTEVTMARSQFRRAPRLENLESRELLSTVPTSEAPSSEAQYMLQVLNLVRTDPQAAVQYLESNITPDVQTTLKYYGVNLGRDAEPDRLDATAQPLAGMERRPRPGGAGP